MGVQLWSKQIEVLEATITHKRIAVRSGHSVGKTFAGACLVLWWLYARRGRVVTTAPTWEHVEEVLWKEINERFHNALSPLPGEIHQTAIELGGPWSAVGLNTNRPSAFQGRHHQKLLVLLDEAPGVDEQVHLEVTTLTTGEQNCTVMIGNPTDTSGTFYEAFKSPQDWFPIVISCFDHPNVIAGKEIIKGAVTRGWIEERRRAWGEGHPFWFSRVLGDFPAISLRGVVPLLWVERQGVEKGYTQAREEAQKHLLPKIGGLDVARYGDNLSVLTIRQGDAILSQESWHHSSITATSGRAAKAIRDENLKVLVVDASGLGAGVADILLEQNLPVVAYNGGGRAFTRETFTNRRTEMWWHLRERFERGRIWLPKFGPDNRLISDLVAPTYTLSSTGRIKVETKEELLERRVRSPDYADSLVCAFAQDEDPAKELEPKPDEALQDPVPMLEAVPERIQNWTQLPDDF